jgi:hypothetical protein
MTERVITNSYRDMWTFADGLGRTIVSLSAR